MFVLNKTREKRVFTVQRFVALDLLEKINLASIGTKDKGHGSRFNSRMRSKAILGLHLTLSHAEI